MKMIVAFVRPSLAERVVRVIERAGLYHLSVLLPSHTDTRDRRAHHDGVDLPRARGASAGARLFRQVPVLLGATWNKQPAVDEGPDEH
ncbi:hypothetical protein [Luteimonas sp. YGD11-2]|uniref:hypothetical protein n=1 Tax=Luteimonas sp. YGD11-2 TaxID=2508168 RepID=UPI0019D6E50B|nr:hypothetical protein [Luteimonas sp. YGD11-2]